MPDSGKELSSVALSTGLTRSTCVAFPGEPAIDSTETSPIQTSTIPSFFTHMLLGGEPTVPIEYEEIVSVVDYIREAYSQAAADRLANSQLCLQSWGDLVRYTAPGRLPSPHPTNGEHLYMLRLVSGRISSQCTAGVVNRSIYHCPSSNSTCVDVIVLRFGCRTGCAPTAWRQLLPLRVRSIRFTTRGKVFLAGKTL